MDSVACVPCLHPTLTRTTLRQCSRMALAMVVMTGRVTMVGLSRWAGTGGSSRTVQRFFATVMPWATLCWVFFRHHLSRSEDGSLLVGDEVVVTKAGKTTHGLDRCFARRYGKPIPGRAFCALSLVSIQQRRAFPVRVEQVVRSDADKAASKAKAAAKTPPPSPATRGPGRPQGRKNTAKTDATLTPELGRITPMSDALRHLIAPSLSLTSLVLDGPFGPHNALHMARQCPVHLLSTLRADSALSWPSTGPDAGRGPRRKEGHKVDDAHMPEKHLKETTVERHIQTRLSQAQRRHKECAPPLHVVMIVKTNLRTQARAPVVLFSSDLDVAYAPLVDS